MSNSQISTLWDLILKAPWAGDDYTIYAKEPWEKDASALLIAMREDGDPAEPAPAVFSYFLEISTCKEILEDVSHQNLSAEKRFDLIVYYAVNDAFPSWLVS